METKSLTNLLVNLYFCWMDAGDILMREIEQRLHTESADLKHEVKQAHTRLMKAARDFRTIYDLYLEQERIACMKKASVDYDICRSDAMDLLRFGLTYADRVNTDADAKAVMDFLHKLPVQVAPDEFINKFHLQ